MFRDRISATIKMASLNPRPKKTTGDHWAVAPMGPAPKAAWQSMVLRMAYQKAMADLAAERVFRRLYPVWN